MVPLLAVLTALATPACVDNEGQWLFGNDTCGARAYFGLCDQAVGYFAPTELLVSDICPVSCGTCPSELTCSDLMNCTNADCSGEVQVTGVGYNFTSPTNAMCQKSCNNCPVRSSSRTNCADDPFNLMQKMHGKTCSELVNTSSCLSFQNTSVGNYPLWVFCPSTCKTCNPDRDYIFCADDPGQQLQKKGSSCTAIGSYGCDYDVSYLDQSVVNKTLVKELCPHMCDACPSKVGNAKNCRDFAVNDYFQFASGSTDPEMRKFLSSYIKGGFHGDPSSCYEIGTDREGGSQTCHLFGRKLTLCLPRECSGRDADDFYRELVAGSYLGNVNARCEHDDDGSKFSSAGFKGSVATLIILSMFVFLNTVLSASHKFTTAFDLTTSMSQLLSYRGGSSSFLDCIRTISVSWVVLGHTYLFFSSSPTFGNPTNELDHITSLRSAPIPASEYAVDSFFWMSGFLGAMLLDKVVEKNPTIFNNIRRVIPAVGISYVQRYLRILPAMGFVMLMGTKFVPDLGFGPNWYRYREQLLLSDPDYCDKYWWRNVLMISNFYDWPDKTCFGWLWYLPCDFQFSLILPFIVVPYSKLKDSNSIFRGIIPALLLIILTINLVLSYTEKLSRLDETYVRPYLRIAPWLFGISSAFFIDCYSVRGRLRHFLIFWKPKNGQDPQSDDVVEMNEVLYENGDTRLEDDSKEISGKGCKPHHRRKKKLIVSLIFLISAGLMLSAIYLLFKRESAHEKKDPWSDDNYKAMNLYYLTAWGLGLSLCSVQFHLGKGGLVLRMMSHPMWSPLGKLSYGVYLVHPLIIYAQGALLNHPVNYTDFWLFYSWVGVLSMSFAASLAIWVLVERPFAAAISSVFRTKRSKPATKDVFPPPSTVIVEEAKIAPEDRILAE